MSERVYQEKMLNSKAKIVFCNWKRGEGKTYSIFRKIIEEYVQKSIYVSQSNNKVLGSYFKRYAERNEYDIKIDKNIKISIDFKGAIEITCLNTISDYNIRGVKDIEYIFFDEYMPTERELDLLKILNPKQIYIMTTKEDMECIDNVSVQDFSDFYDEQIKELMIEYASTPKKENTTMTRDKILQQIKMLKDMKRDSK